VSGPKAAPDQASTSAESDEHGSRVSTLARACKCRGANKKHEHDAIESSPRSSLCCTYNRDLKTTFNLQ
jgi:hypothetical protein